MKNSIKLTALLLVASVSFLAVTPSMAAAPAKDGITFSSTPSQKGIEVKVEKSATAKAYVVISDKDGNILRKDILSAKKGFDKAYIVNQLDNGDYTIKVTLNSQTAQKNIHVYDEDGVKQFFVTE